MPDHNISFPFKGQFTGGIHTMPLRVYFEDTDAGGVLFHGSSIRFFERGRTEFVRNLGISQSHFLSHNDPTGFLVRHIDVNYLKPAHLDDVLLLETKISSIKRTSCVFQQTLMNINDPALVYVQGHVTCVHVSMIRKKPIPLPSFILDVFDLSSSKL